MSDERKTVRYERGREAGASGPKAGADETVPYDRKGKLGQRVGQGQGADRAQAPLRGDKQELTQRAGARPGKDQKAEPNFVVGWLVVESGIGQGRSFPLFNQRNSIGRAPSQDVALAFVYGEDNEISRENHCFIGFEPKQSLFIAEKGESNNYTYVNSDVLLNARVLQPFDRIELGSTKLVFVPFCGDEFQWNSDKTSTRE